MVETIAQAPEVARLEQRAKAESYRQSFDQVKLAELRDAHSEKVTTYRRKTDEARSAAQAAVRARLEAPPLPGAIPTGGRVAYASGIGVTPKPVKIRPRTNDFYLQPLAVLQSHTREELAVANVDQQSFARIVAAETRRERLKTEQYQAAAAVRDSATIMARIEQFAKETRL